MIERTGEPLTRAEGETVALEMAAEKLVEMLRKYGSHVDGCMVYINGTCYCGWEELKAKLKGDRK